MRTILLLVVLGAAYSLTFHHKECPDTQVADPNSGECVCPTAKPYLDSTSQCVACESPHEWNSTEKQCYGCPRNSKYDEKTDSCQQCPNDFVNRHGWCYCPYARPFMTKQQKCV